MPSGGAIVARADRNQQQLPFPLTPATTTAPRLHAAAAIHLSLLSLKFEPFPCVALEKKDSPIQGRGFEN